MITPHDLDLPDEATAVAQVETIEPPKNSPEFEAHDARMKPENREIALSHLSALRSMLETNKADKEAATAAHSTYQSRARLRSKANLYAQVRTQRPTRKAA